MGDREWAERRELGWGSLLIGVGGLGGGGWDQRLVGGGVREEGGSLYVVTGIYPREGLRSGDGK